MPYDKDYKDVQGYPLGNIPPGLTRTAFTVVVDDVKEWTIQDLLSAVWDGRTDVCTDPLNVYVRRDTISSIVNPPV